MLKNIVFDLGDVLLEFKNRKNIWRKGTPGIANRSENTLNPRKKDILASRRIYQP